jgi:diguanylate cyclase (GGDEF)-like protein
MLLNRESQTLEIVKRCLIIDETAHHTYRALATYATNPSLKQFWHAMAEEEEAHVTFWRKIVSDVLLADKLPILFDDANEVIAELDAILPKVKKLNLGNLAELSVEDSFIVAYWLEFYMLHPAFEVLYHLLHGLIKEPCPQDEYENHINRFVTALAEHGKVTPALELLGETLQRLWRENKKLAERATRDGLTDCLNRQAFNEIARQLCFLARRKNETVGMLMIDLDHFKRVNDELGHLVGDMVIKFAGQTIQKNIREADVVARYGGEEFIVCMPNTELKLAREVAERVRIAFSQMEIDSLSPTLSIGVSVKTVGDNIDTSIQELLKEADANLYRAKEMGRNRVV